MKTMGAAKFKEQCLALLDHLDDEGLVITKRGRPIARVVRYEREFADFIGCLHGKLDIRGEIMSTGARWDADAES